MSNSATPDDLSRSVLFVCLGNICRSPLAQGVTEHLARERGVRDRLRIESCGTGAWHVGNSPDPRTIDVALRNGVTLNSLARQFDPRRDFERFQLILAMDKRNQRDILAAAGSRADPARVRLFLEFADPALAEPHGLEVPDPYYGGPEGFDLMYRLVRSGAEGVLRKLLGERTT